MAPMAISLTLAVVFTPLAIAAARRFDFIDRPRGLKLHKLPTPLLGGTAVYLAFFVTAVIFLPIEGPVRGILAGGAVAVVLGVVDDRIGLPPLIHLFGQIVAGVVAIVTGVGYVNNISNPFATVTQVLHGRGSWTLLPIIGIGFTLFWIVGMMNTVNFLDGLDGLSSGVGVIVALVLAIWALNRNNDFHGHYLTAYNHAPAVLAVVLAGALLGFLPYNWNPARIFIGDSGAMFVGFALGVISVSGIAKIGTALIIISIPLLDVVWAIARRTLHGKSFLAGDKQHVYHRMVELGMSPKAVVLSLYAIGIALAAIDLNIAHMARLVAFAVIAVIAGSGFIILEVAANRRRDISPPVREKHRKAEARG